MLENSWSFYVRNSIVKKSCELHLHDTAYLNLEEIYFYSILVDTTTEITFHYARVTFPFASRRWILGLGKISFMKLQRSTKMHENMTLFIYKNYSWKFRLPTYFMLHALLSTEIILSHWSPICIDSLVMYRLYISVGLTIYLFAISIVSLKEKENLYL